MNPKIYDLFVGETRYGFVHIGRVGSVLLTLSVTVERFFAIVYPLKRIRRTRFLIYSSVIGSIAYNIPRFFEFKTNYVNVTENYISNNTNADRVSEDVWQVSLISSYALLFYRILKFGTKQHVILTEK